MCGIVGVAAQRDVIPLLINGLQRLEYRGYDSAGVAVQSDQARLERVRKVGKVAELMRALKDCPVSGQTGIAHTRWATHGEPSEKNAHPHVCHERVAVVHNGIIENHDALRAQQQQTGYRFTSQTDTEVIVHQIDHYLEQGKDLLEAVRLLRGGSSPFAFVLVGRGPRHDELRRAVDVVTDAGTRLAIFGRVREPGITDRSILVGEELTASVLGEIPREKLAGLISVRGSGNSHVAILARAMGFSYPLEPIGNRATKENR